MGSEAKPIQVSEKVLHIVNSIYQAKFDTPKLYYVQIIEVECAAEFKDKKITEDDITFLLSKVNYVQHWRESWSGGTTPKYSVFDLKQMVKRIKADARLEQWCKVMAEQKAAAGKQGEASTSKPKAAEKK